MNLIDKKICAQLWEENVCRMRKICGTKFHSCPDEIEDVLSEVFLAFCEKTSKDGLPEKPRAWLYGTFNNIINLKYREMYRIKGHNERLSYIGYELTFQHDFIEEIIDQIFLDEIIDELKQILSSDEYLLIQYIYFEELKMKEVAKLLDTTEAAVKQKHYRICYKLRKATKNL